MSAQITAPYITFQRCNLAELTFALLFVLSQKLLDSWGLEAKTKSDVHVGEPCLHVCANCPMSASKAVRYDVSLFNKIRYENNYVCFFMPKQCWNGVVCMMAFTFVIWTKNVTFLFIDL